MAAHSIRILTGIYQAGNDERRRDQLRHALDYAPGMDVPEIEPGQYRGMTVALDRLDAEALDEVLLNQIHRQLEKWDRLGRPRDAEAWREAWHKAVQSGATDV